MSHVPCILARTPTSIPIARRCARKTVNVFIVYSCTAVYIQSTHITHVLNIHHMHMRHTYTTPAKTLGKLTAHERVHNKQTHIAHSKPSSSSSDRQRPRCALLASAKNTSRERARLLVVCAAAAQPCKWVLGCIDLLPARTHAHATHTPTNTAESPRRGMA